MASIRFLGGAGTVTGSRYLIEAHGRQVLIDAGLFQGKKELRLRNWAPLPIDPAKLGGVVLTHAHIDHLGALPLLVRNGFRGPAYCTPATGDLAQLLLPDSGRLQEEEARFANRRGYSKHAPHARPLYTEADAVSSLARLTPQSYHRQYSVVPGMSAVFHRAGHILGSALVELHIEAEGSAPAVSILFSGDLGRYDAPILTDPEPAPAAQVLLVECTYGDRKHTQESPAVALAQEVNQIAERRGVLLVPAFAVGRTQELLFHLRQLESQGSIPALPVYVDSPMAVDATPIYLTHREDHDQEMDRLYAAGVAPLRPSKLTLARSPEESKVLNRLSGPFIIISASGMATGGRVLHHLARLLPQESTTVLLVGYQAAGTRGWSLQNGARFLRIHGEEIPVRARVATIGAFSAHGDQDEVARWLATLPSPPRRTFCIHGEGNGLTATAERLRAAGWRADIPAHLEQFDLAS